MSSIDIANALCFQPLSLSTTKTDISHELSLSTVNELESIGFQIDAEQKEAILNALTHVLTLLWGPAGTGKTDTMAHYLLSILMLSAKKGTKNMLIGSNNYGAIDNLLNKVINKSGGLSNIETKFYRIKSSSSEPYKENGGPNFIEFDPRDEDKVKSFIDDLLSENVNCVVGGTWKQLFKIAEGRVEWFDICVIDEATQIGTVAAFGYFTTLKNKAHIIVGGDHRQLGTIYAYDNNLEAGIYDSIFNYYRDDHGIAMKKLNKTYRSNDHVATWPRERFYENAYTSYFRDKRVKYNTEYTQKPDGWPDNLLWDDSLIQIIAAESPVVVIIHNEASSTLSNMFESELIVSLSYLIKLSMSNVKCDDLWKNYLGIVSPHRAQNSMIRNKLLGREIFTQQNGMAIDTVDSFQGREREIILNSYVVSDIDYIQREEEFILDARRFNVTLTRAKSKFVMIISASMAGYLSSDYRVAEDASHLQLFSKEYCSNVIASPTLRYIMDDGDEELVKCEVRVPSI